MKVHPPRRRQSTDCSHAGHAVAPELHDRAPKWTLQPPPPTRREQLCTCTGAPPLKLVGGAGFNPLHCLECGSEADARSLHLGQDLLDDIERWRFIAGGIYDLWYWSEEYDDWAELQLMDPRSPVNSLGRSVQARIDRVRRCYYEYFAEEVIWEPESPKACPACGLDLSVWKSGPLLPIHQAACHPCSIVLSWLDEDDDVE